jgi:hypothetical protein
MGKNGGESPSSIDKLALRRLYRSDKAAKAIFDHLAERQRNWEEVVDVQRLAAKLDVPRPEVMRALKAFQKAGLGRYIMGRRRQKSRFQRYVDLVAVARYASGQATDIDEGSLTSPGEDEAPDATGTRNGSGGHRHEFQLRPHLQVSLNLPLDLTAPEADRLAGFIRTLPFS